MILRFIKRHYALFLPVMLLFTPLTTSAAADELQYISSSIDSAIPCRHTPELLPQVPQLTVWAGSISQKPQFQNRSITDSIPEKIHFSRIRKQTPTSSFQPENTFTLAVYEISISDRAGPRLS